MLSSHEGLGLRDKYSIKIQNNNILRLKLLLEETLCMTLIYMYDIFVKTSEYNTVKIKR